MRTKTLRSLALAIVAAALVLATLPSGAEQQEAPGTIEFKAHNKMYNAHGKFEKWHFTTVEIPDGDLTQGKVEFEIDLASVWEKASQLADHLRQADFFNVAKFATATVKIHGAEKTGDNTYKANALVNFHGHDGEVPVTFEVVNASPLEIKGSATLSRTAFGIGEPYDASNDRSITDDVEIMISATVQ